MSYLLNGCFAVLNIAPNSCLIQNFGDIYQNIAIFQATARIFVPAVKLPPPVVNDSDTTKKPPLLSSFKIAHVHLKGKNKFCKAEPVMKP